MILRSFSGDWWGIDDAARNFFAGATTRSAEAWLLTGAGRIQEWVPNANKVPVDLSGESAGKAKPRGHPRATLTISRGLTFGIWPGHEVFIWGLSHSTVNPKMFTSTHRHLEVTDFVGN